MFKNQKVHKFINGAYFYKGKEFQMPKGPQTKNLKISRLIESEFYPVARYCLLELSNLTNPKDQILNQRNPKIPGDVQRESKESIKKYMLVYKGKKFLVMSGIKIDLGLFSHSFGKDEKSKYCEIQIHKRKKNEHSFNPDEWVYFTQYCLSYECNPLIKVLNSRRNQDTHSRLGISMDIRNFVAGHKYILYKGKGISVKKGHESSIWTKIKYASQMKMDLDNFSKFIFRRKSPNSFYDSPPDDDIMYTPGYYIDLNINLEVEWDPYIPWTPQTSNKSTKEFNKHVLFLLWLTKFKNNDFSKLSHDIILYMIVPFLDEAEIFEQQHQPYFKKARIKILKEHQIEAEKMILFEDKTGEKWRSKFLKYFTPSSKKFHTFEFLEALCIFKVFLMTDDRRNLFAGNSQEKYVKLAYVASFLSISWFVDPKWDYFYECADICLDIIELCWSNFNEVVITISKNLVESLHMLLQVLIDDPNPKWVSVEEKVFDLLNKIIAKDPKMLFLKKVEKTKERDQLIYVKYLESRRLLGVKNSRYHSCVHESVVFFQQLIQTSLLSEDHLFEFIVVLEKLFYYGGTGKGLYSVSLGCWSCRLCSILLEVIKNPKYMHNFISSKVVPYMIGSNKIQNYYIPKLSCKCSKEDVDFVNTFYWLDMLFNLTTLISNEKIPFKIFEGYKIPQFILLFNERLFERKANSHFGLTLRFLNLINVDEFIQTNIKMSKKFFSQAMRHLKGFKSLMVDKETNVTILKEVNMVVGLDQTINEGENATLVIQHLWKLGGDFQIFWNYFRDLKELFFYHYKFSSLHVNMLRVMEKCPKPKDVKVDISQNEKFQVLKSITKNLTKFFPGDDEFPIHHHNGSNFTFERLYDTFVVVLRCLCHQITTESRNLESLEIIKPVFSDPIIIMGLLNIIEKIQCKEKRKILHYHLIDIVDSLHLQKNEEQLLVVLSLVKYLDDIRVLQKFNIWLEKCGIAVSNYDKRFDMLFIVSLREILKKQYAFEQQLIHQNVFMWSYWELFQQKPESELIQNEIPNLLISFVYKYPHFALSCNADRCIVKSEGLCKVEPRFHKTLLNLSSSKHCVKYFAGNMKRMIEIWKEKFQIFDCLCNLLTNEELLKEINVSEFFTIIDRFLKNWDSVRGKREVFELLMKMEKQFKAQNDNRSFPFEEIPNNMMKNIFQTSFNSLEIKDVYSVIEQLVELQETKYRFCMFLIEHVFSKTKLKELIEKNVILESLLDDYRKSGKFAANEKKLQICVGVMKKLELFESKVTPTSKNIKEMKEFVDLVDTKGLTFDNNDDVRKLEQIEFGELVISTQEKEGFDPKIEKFLAPNFEVTFQGITGHDGNKEDDDKKEED